jgi:hypothetical protein
LAQYSTKICYTRTHHPHKHGDQVHTLLYRDYWPPGASSSKSPAPSSHAAHTRHCRTLIPNQQPSCNHHKPIAQDYIFACHTSQSSHSTPNAAHSSSVNRWHSWKWHSLLVKEHPSSVPYPTQHKTAHPSCHRSPSVAVNQADASASHLCTSAAHAEDNRRATCQYTNMQQLQPNK